MVQTVPEFARINLKRANNGMKRLLFDLDGLASLVSAGEWVSSSLKSRPSSAARCCTKS